MKKNEIWFRKPTSLPCLIVKGNKIRIWIKLIIIEYKNCFPVIVRDWQQKKSVCKLRRGWMNRKKTDG